MRDILNEKHKKISSQWEKVYNQLYAIGSVFANHKGSSDPQSAEVPQQPELSNDLIVIDYDHRSVTPVKVPGPWRVWQSPT